MDLGNRNLVLVVLQHGRVEVVALGKHVNVCRRELACRYALLKEQVEFGKRAACGLGDAEVRVDEAEEADSSLFARPVSVMSLPEEEFYEKGKRIVGGGQM